MGSIALYLANANDNRQTGRMFGCGFGGGIDIANILALRAKTERGWAFGTKTGSVRFFPELVLR